MESQDLHYLAVILGIEVESQDLPHFAKKDLVILAIEMESQETSLQVLWTLEGLQAEKKAKDIN